MSIIDVTSGSRDIPWVKGLPQSGQDCPELDDPLGFITAAALFGQMVLR